VICFGLCVFGAKSPTKFGRRNGLAGGGWLGMRRACACAVKRSERVLVCPQGTTQTGRKEGRNREFGVWARKPRSAWATWGMREEAQRRLRGRTNAKIGGRLREVAQRQPRAPAARLNDSRRQRGTSVRHTGCPRADRSELPVHLRTGRAPLSDAYIDAWQPWACVGARGVASAP
jgi:hypothetical protein